MADDITKNPPQIDLHAEGAGSDKNVNIGSLILRYGLSDVSVTGILVDSYSRSAKFANMEEIVNQNGVVEGIRMSDARTEVSVSGRIKASVATTAKAGAIITVAGESSLVTEVSLSAGSKEFVKFDIKATSYEGITAITPLGT